MENIPGNEVARKSTPNFGFFRIFVSSAVIVPDTVDTKNV
jgi:hypothetical protein